MSHAPHFVKCQRCKEEFDIGAGYILLHVCPTCLAKPAPPPAYVGRSGLLVPNPDANHNPS